MNGNFIPIISKSTIKIAIKLKIIKIGISDIFGRE